MTQEEMSERKAQLRVGLIRARDSLSEGVRQEKSAALCRHILSLEEYRSAKTVMIYKYVRGEVQLGALEEANACAPEAERKRFVYPVCLSEGEMIAICPGSPDTDSIAWKKGAFGIPEPDPARGEIVPPEEIDLVICPCTGVDERGMRLGMGGGFYDRFLPRCHGAKVLAAVFEVQRIPEVPALPWDQPVDGVVTERRAELL